MFNWIALQIGLHWSDVNAAYRYVVGLIQTVINWVTGIWNNLTAGLVQLYRDVLALYQALKDYVVTNYNILKSFAVIGLTEVRNWATRAFDDVWSYLQYLYNLTGTIVTNVLAQVRRWINDVEVWAINNIWVPIMNYVNGILDQLNAVRATLYGFISHPETIVAMLGGYLWGSWLTLLKKYATPIARWLMHTMMGMAHELADVLETIIAAML